jgi:integral membrane protein
MKNLNEQLINWSLIVGKIEGYSYLVLLFIAMPLKYVFHIPQLIRPVGSLHGLLFVTFLVLLSLLLFKVKLSFKNVAIAFLLSLIPFGTFFLKKFIAL